MTAENSSQLPYQVCLMTIFTDEETQLQARDITNFVVIPINMVVTFMSLVCNALVVITVARTKSLQQPPLLMLSSLAMTDVLFTIYTLYRHIEILAHEHKCPAPASPESAALYPLCLLATLGNLAIISRDRYLAVTKPWWYRIHVTKSRALKMICIPWITSAVLTVFLYLSVKTKDRFPPIGKIMSLLFYFLCAFLIIIYYLGLFCKKTPPEEALNIRAILEREKRTANTVSWILLALVVTFLPGVLTPLVLHANDVPNFIIYTPYYGFLLELNGLLNPLLNFGRSKEMRKALRDLFKRSQQVQPTQQQQQQLNNNNNNANRRNSVNTNNNNGSNNNNDESRQQRQQ